MGETGADDPIQATDDGLREFAANEIVFVTKPGTSTDWVEQGVDRDGDEAIRGSGHRTSLSRPAELAAGPRPGTIRL